jgi:hypothetical protein
MSSKASMLAAALCAALFAAPNGVANAAPIFSNTFFEIYFDRSTFPLGLLEEKIFLDKLTDVNTVTGTTENTGATVHFTSTDKLDSGSGFSNIKEHDNGVFNDLDISVVDHFFTDLIFQATLEKPGNNEPDNSLSIEVFGAGGGSLGSFSAFDSDQLEALYSASSNAELLVLAISPTVFSHILLTSPVGLTVGGLEQTKQFEISGVAAVPIPAALPLLASGLGGLGLMGWWRRRRRNA